VSRAHRVGLPEDESSSALLTDAALDFVVPFTARELALKSQVHPSDVGSWLVNQVVNGNLTRVRVNGTWTYEWSP
jgi:hypothetical protein